MKRLAIVLASLLGTTAAVHAADPVRIGITTILSGPTADRGQSEQYGAQIAIDRINDAGGVLGRPVEAFYADNACKPAIGVPATQRLVEQEHVPVIIGALCTPVTHAIMPELQADHVPLIIATSAGQDFVDASGVGGDDYAFKTIPSEVDIARGLFHFLGTQNVKSVAILVDAGRFPEASGTAFGKEATAAAMTVTDQEVLKPGTDFAALLDKLKAQSPDRLVIQLGASAPAFFKAYEASGWKVPITGRTDPAVAIANVSPQFRDAGGLAGMTAVSVFTPLLPTSGVAGFVAEYRARYGLMPTQRSFFVFEAVNLAVDAIRRAGTDSPEAIEQALKTTTMPSLVGGTYAMDDHNHPHTPMLIIGMRDNKPAVVAAGR